MMEPCLSLLTDASVSIYDTKWAWSCTWNLTASKQERDNQNTICRMAACAAAALSHRTTLSSKMIFIFSELLVRMWVEMCSKYNQTLWVRVPQCFHF